MKDITFEIAKKHIEEWGIDSDNFILGNLKHSMNGGDPTDNSIELDTHHQKCLKAVVDVGLKNQSLLAKISRLTVENRKGDAAVRAYKQGVKALDSAIVRAKKGLEIYKGSESQELRKAIIKWYTRAKNIIEENRKVYLKTHK